MPISSGEGGPAAAPITVRVCESLSCAMAGAGKLLAQLPANSGQMCGVMRAPCVGACDLRPGRAVGHVQVMKATPRRSRRRSNPMPAPILQDGAKDLAAYQADGGYGC